MSRFLFVVLLLAAAGCGASPQRPSAMAQVDRVRSGQAAEEASRLAPQAYQAAEQLRRESEAAFDDGDRAAAAVLAEHALAAYSHADVLARVARGEKRLAEASEALEKKRAELAELDEEQRRVAAEADDLEMRARVARDAVPLADNEPASPERERARLDAARSMALEARLLCTAARLLDPQLDGLEALLARLARLDDQLSSSPKTTPIDEAIRTRSGCLALLSTARRPALREHPEESPGDALVAVLGEAGFEPHRDDRGVSVALRGVFEGNAVAASAKERLVALGQAAAQHPGSPLLVVVHRARGQATETDAAHGRRVAEILQGAGASRVDVETAGDAKPVVPTGRPAAASRNERIEVIFVTPGW